MGDLVAKISDAAIDNRAIDRLCAEYEDRYKVAKELRKGGARHDALRYGARIELGLRAFLEEGGFKGFTTTFEDLHGLRQLPGLAVQRLMADGYGFGAEGDWKTCALLRAMKVMGAGLPGGTSFMEDYTYHLDPKRPPGARRAHARDLRVDRRGQALARNPSARHRRQGGPGAPGVRRARRPGAQRLADRPGQPLPPDRQRSRRRQAAQAAAEAARGPRRVGVPARLQDRLRVLDSRRRRAPHRLQLQP